MGLNIGASLPPSQPASPLQPSTPAKAQAAENTPPAQNKQGAHNIEIGVGVAEVLWKVLTQSGKADDLKSLTRAEKQDDAMGTLVASVTELAVAKNGSVKGLDDELHDNFNGTIDKYVTNPNANRILKGIGNIFGDQLASVLIAGIAGDLANTVQDIRRNPAQAAMMRSDPATFGKLVLGKVGDKLPKDLATAWTASKLKDVPVVGHFAVWVAPWLTEKFMK